MTTKSIFNLLQAKAYNFFFSIYHSSSTKKRFVVAKWFDLQNINSRKKLVKANKILPIVELNLNFF